MNTSKFLLKYFVSLKSFTPTVMRVNYIYSIYMYIVIRSCFTSTIIRSRERMAISSVLFVHKFCTSLFPNDIYTSSLLVRKLWLCPNAIPIVFAVSWCSICSINWRCLQPTDIHRKCRPLRDAVDLRFGARNVNHRRRSHFPVVTTMWA